MGLILVLLFIAMVLSVVFFVALVGTLIAFLPWIIVGLIAGWVASKITDTRHGVFGDIAIGLAGSLIGGVLYVLLTGHQPGGPLSLPHILVAILGSVLLLLAMKKWGHAGPEGI